jgi:uncharacterized protein (DUF3820 family)
MTDTIDFGTYSGLEWDKLSSEYLNGLADMGNQKAKEQLDKIYNSPIESQKVGFGKFAGYRWIDLDIDYLKWILNNIDRNNIKFLLANKALNYIYENINIDDIDVIYVD